MTDTKAPQLLASSDRRLLAMHDVYAGYGNRPVLHGISLDVAVHDVVALFGDNGAGKSTLLKAICGAVEVESGQIHLNGKPIAGLMPHRTQHLGISYLMQAGRVFPNLSVAQNIAVARRKARALLPQQNGEPLCPGLAVPPGMRAGLLSAGQRQLLALEMALAQCPTLLLLDEPTAGLASDIATAVTDRIAAFAKTPGNAVILAEQNTETACRIATHTVLLDHGRVLRVDREPTRPITKEITTWHAEPS